MSTSFQRQIVLQEIVALANLTKNRNIKANDVNFISMARSTDFCFDRLYVAFNVLLVVRHPHHHQSKSSFPWTPHPTPAFQPPPPSLWNFQWSSMGGGRVWICSGTTQCIKTVEALLTDTLISGSSNYGHLHKTPLFSTLIKTLYFYIPLSGQPQLQTPFSHPEGVGLRELPL